jgi:uncharacterized glyoxalase superfamily protein PhnB
MSTAKPAHVRWMIPHITVQDVSKALAFYSQAFGFILAEQVKDENDKVVHAEMNWQDELIMLGAEGAHGSTIQSPASSGVSSAVNLYIYCQNVDALYQRAIQAGAKSLMEPSDMFWGDRMCKVADPDGIHWAFATHTARV